MNYNDYAKFTDSTAVYETAIEDRYLGHLRYAVNAIWGACASHLDEEEFKVVEDALDVLESLDALLEHDLELFYEVMGFAGEAGEVANKAKKILRDGADTDTLNGELGGVTYYHARLAKRLYPNDPSQVMDENMTELQSRLERNVLHGNGDDR
jgi:NTP pyrophosphatase (non-canonical NTP hydrolase)